VRLRVVRRLDRRTAIAGPSPGRSRCVGVLGIAVLLGTFGSFAMAFGVGTSCADEWSCGPYSCAPCSRITHWAVINAAGQGVIVIVLAVLLVRRLGRDGLRMYVVAPVALALSFAMFVLALSQASSYPTSRVGMETDASDRPTVGRC
jgi:hypothetical protein